MKNKAEELPSGFVLLQEENGRACYAACLVGHFSGWLMWKHPDGQWVSKRKLEAWELMQVEDQRDDAVVFDSAPVQPVAVPDDEAAYVKEEHAKELARAESFLAHWKGRAEKAEAALAAPAAQGDTKDAERFNWVAHHGAALRIDLDNKWYVDAPYHTGISCVDDHKRFPTAREAIDTAIAAKAVMP